VCQGNAEGGEEEENWLLVRETGIFPAISLVGIRQRCRQILLAPERGGWQWLTIINP